MCFRSPFSLYKCGHCPECLQEKRREWSIRLQLHAKMCGCKPYIAHLTYDNEHVPINEYGNLTLQYKDVQDFLKRLRYYLNTYYNATNFKYFIAGEYGPNGSRRPHYHCILFGMPEENSQDETNALLQKAWQNGKVRDRSQWVKSYAQLHYVTKYLINYFDEDFSKKTAPFRKCSNGFGYDFITWAKKSNFYKIELQQLFICNTEKRKVNNSRCTEGHYFIDVPTNWILEKPGEYLGNGKYWLNPILSNFPNYIEFVENINGKDKLYRFPLPRYFAEKLYTRDFRFALAQYNDFLSRMKHYDYNLEYNDYDVNSDVPMWLQIKRHKWEQKKKNKKDKQIRINVNNILND